MKTIAKLIGMISVLALLVSCGGGGSASFTGGGSSGGGGNVGAAHTIALSYPVSDSIENVGGGFYRRVGTATVTDSNGNALADGTQVRLEVIDSIIATGVIGDSAGDSVSGTTFSDDNPTEADGITATDFVTASVERTTGSGDIRTIMTNDEVLFFDFASGIDKRRFVAAVPSATNSMSVTTAYSQSYPNATYDLPAYIVGASLLGASIAGEDADGNPTQGVATMENGVATFHVTYPANVDTILTGCYDDPSVDERSSPSGSAQVFVVARTSDSKVITLDNSFCFAAIAGVTVTAFPETSSASAVVSLTVRDGGDTVRLPYVEAEVGIVTTGTASVVVTPDPLVTDESGVATATVTFTPGASGDTAVVTFKFFDGTATATFTSP